MTEIKREAKQISCSDYLLHKDCPMYRIEGRKACIGCQSAINPKIKKQNISIEDVTWTGIF